MPNRIEFLTKGAMQGETPKGATIAFRVVFLLTTAITAWIAGTGLIGEAVKVEVVLILKAVDFIAWGVSKMFGVVIEQE